MDGLAPPEPAERPAAEPVSLLDALQASLEATSKDRSGGARKRPPRKRASASHALSWQRRPK